MSSSNAVETEIQVKTGVTDDSVSAKVEHLKLLLATLAAELVRKTAKRAQ